MPGPDEKTLRDLGGVTKPEGPEPALTEEQKEKLALHAKINGCLKEYKLESNIPLQHDYWNWQNQMRALNAKY